MKDYTDYRDAFLLWIVADANLMAAGGLLAYAPTFSTQIAVAMMATAITCYTAAAGLMVLSAMSILAGWKKVGGKDA